MNPLSIMLVSDSLAYIGPMRKAIPYIGNMIMELFPIRFFLWLINPVHMISRQTPVLPHFMKLLIWFLLIFSHLFFNITSISISVLQKNIRFNSWIYFLTKQILKFPYISCWLIKIIHLLILNDFQYMILHKKYW